MRWAIEQGDCLELLRLLPSCSIDSVVTDPPAGISFMGREWDSDKGGRNVWVAWFTKVMRECWRVLKPGGHALVWAIPRTSHWPKWAIEDAGFEIRDTVTHHFGSGFPKSQNVSKEIDRVLKRKRKVVGKNPNHRAVSGVAYDGVYAGANTGASTRTAPASAEAQEWDDFGTALKPATEEWILARKPLDDIMARNLLKHRTGALNIKGCRITTEEPLTRKLGKTTESASGWKSTKRSEVAGKDGGRWPANLVLSHALGCVRSGRKLVKGDNRPSRAGKRPGGFYTPGASKGTSDPNGVLHGDQMVPVWHCTPGCPVAALDMQSGLLKSGAFSGKRNTDKTRTVYGAFRGTRSEKPIRGDKGGASRFFYQAKPPKKEKEAGLVYFPRKKAGEVTGGRKEGSAGLKNPRAGAGRTSGARNVHPTVKSVDLMRWLIRLITPPGGIVLDPFTGSGTTGVAARAEGLRFLGFEQDSAFVRIATARVFYADTKLSLQPAHAAQSALLWRLRAA